MYHFLSPIDGEHRAERERSAADDVRTGIPAPKESTRALFTRNHILTDVLIFCSLYGFFSMLTWLPTYLQQVRDVPAADTGTVSSLVPWASIPRARAWALHPHKRSAIDPEMAGFRREKVTPPKHGAEYSSENVEHNRWRSDRRTVQ